MVVSESKGSTRLNKQAMKVWEQRIEKAKEKQRERRQQLSDCKAASVDDWTWTDVEEYEVDGGEIGYSRVMESEAEEAS